METERHTVGKQVRKGEEERRQKKQRRKMGSWDGAGVGERQSESLPYRLYYYFLSSCCLSKA